MFHSCFWVWPQRNHEKLHYNPTAFLPNFTFLSFRTHLDVNDFFDMDGNINISSFSFPDTSDLILLPLWSQVAQMLPSPYHWANLKPFTLEGMSSTFPVLNISWLCFHFPSFCIDFNNRCFFFFLTPLFKNCIFTYFVFGWAGSSLLCKGFLQLWRARAPLCWWCAVLASLAAEYGL